MAGAGAAPVYLLYGEESLLRDRRARELLEGWLPAENAEYNRDVFQGPDVDLDAVVGVCETLPVMAERRVVLVRNLDLKAAAAHSGFVAYLRRPNPSTVLLLTAGAVAGAGGGKREKPGAAPAGRGKASARAALSARDLVSLIPDRSEFTMLRAEQAWDFARSAARTRGAELEPDAARLLVEWVGVDSGRIEDEVEKMALYAGARNRIAVSDVEALVRHTRSHTMFELTDAIAEGDRDAMLRHLHALLGEGSDPLALVGMVAWHFRRTLRGAALVERGASAADLARTLGIQYRMQERFRETCRRLGTLRAAQAIRSLRQADRELKIGAGDSGLALERVLLELMGAPAGETGPGTAAAAASR